MDDPAVVGAAVNVAIPLVLLLAAYFTGTAVERRHYRAIRRREQRWRALPAVNFEQMPASWEVVDSGLVSGSVVVSVDYFKRFLAGLRMLVGGRVKGYESLVDRARREAVLRLKQDAMDHGYHAVLNVRMETFRVANSWNRNQATAGLEVLAFGTGLKLARRPV